MSCHPELQLTDRERCVRSQSDIDLQRFDCAGELSAKLQCDADLDCDRSLQQLQHRQSNHHGGRHASADDFDAAFSEMTKTPPDGILMVTDILTVLNRKRVMQYAEEHRLPAIYEYARFAHDGGLMAYGPDENAIFDRAAGLADRILKGAKPADLPVVQSTKFEFVINLGTARALGIEVPSGLLAITDEVIE